MYLFARALRLTGGPEALAWCNEVCDKVRQVSDFPLQLWAGVYGPEFGTVHFTTWVPDLAAMESGADKLMVDSGYQALQQKGAQFSQGMPDDTMNQLVYGEPDPDADPTYVTGQQAVCSSGNLVRGMTVAVGIAEHASKATGNTTLVMRPITGAYGSVGWITGLADIAAVQASEEALAASGFAEFLDREAKGVYTEDAAVTQGRLYRKLG